MTPPLVFDRNARRSRRDRIAGSPPGPFETYLADAIAERLDAVSRNFEHALVINGGAGAAVAMLNGRGIATTVTDVGARFATILGGHQCDEDHIETLGTGYDLVIAPCGLDTVDDLPGALILARRALRPDGLFLATFPAGPSLPALRAAVAHADASSEVAIARLHPQIDVRAAGDLLVRAGFALSVADAETLRLSYRDVGSLITDLRSAAATNVLAERRAVSRAWLARLSEGFAARAEADSRVIETVAIVTLTGWAPAGSQPKPARRGSGSVSLGQVLASRIS